MNVTVQNSHVHVRQRATSSSAVADGTGGGALVFTGNTISNNHPAIATGGGGVTLTGGAAGRSHDELLQQHLARLADDRADDQQEPRHQAGQRQPRRGTINDNDDRRDRRSRTPARSRAPASRPRTSVDGNHDADDHEQHDPPVQLDRHAVRGRRRRSPRPASSTSTSPATRSRTRAPTRASRCSRASAWTAASRPATRSRRAPTSARTRSPGRATRRTRTSDCVADQNTTIRLPGYAGARRARRERPPSPTFVSGQGGRRRAGHRAGADTPGQLHRHRDDMPVGASRWLSPSYPRSGS